MTEDEKQFRKEQIELLNVIVKKLITIEKGQEAMETSLFCGITRSLGKTIQKMRTEIIREIRPPKRKHSVWKRLWWRTKSLWWSTLKKLGL